MEKDRIRRDNVIFFVVAVGQCMYLTDFAQAILSAINFDAKLVNYPTDNVEVPGYVKVDFSTLARNKKKRLTFINKINGGVLKKVATDFNSSTDFKGDFAEEVRIAKDGYVFHFCIKQYERDKEHQFEIIEPTALEEIPNEEKLGRVVHLAVMPEQLL